MNIRKVRNTYLDSIDDAAQDVVASVIALADNQDNIEELARLASALHAVVRGTEAYATMKTSLYSLDEYVDLKRAKLQGETVNEQYLAQLRKDLLKARL